MVIPKLFILSPQRLGRRSTGTEQPPAESTVAQVRASRTMDKIPNVRVWRGRVINQSPVAIPFCPAPRENWVFYRDEDGDIDLADPSQDLPPYARCLAITDGVEVYWNRPILRTREQAEIQAVMTRKFSRQWVDARASLISR
jgi:hypothetical protein